MWLTTTFIERRKVLKTLQKYILKNQDTIARAACLDSGKTRVDASFGEILVTAEKISWTIKHGEKALKSETRPTNFLMMGKQNEVRYEPLGVVAACVSWKYVNVVQGGCTLDANHGLATLSIIFSGPAYPLSSPATPSSSRQASKPRGPPNSSSPSSKAR